MYSCKECGAKAEVTSEGTRRTCLHTGTIVLDMDVTCYGESGAGESSFFNRIYNLGLEVLKYGLRR